MNNLYEEKEKAGGHVRRRGGPGLRSSPAVGWSGAQTNHPLGPFQTRLIQGSAARACLLAGPTSPGSGNSLGPLDGGLSGPLLPLGPAALPRVNASPATSAWSRTRAGSTSPRLPPGPPGPVPRAPASRRPRPLRRGLLSPAGLLNPTRLPDSSRPSPGGPFRRPSSQSSSRPVHPADTPRPAYSLSALRSCLLPQASFHPPAGRPTFTLSFPIVFLPRLCTHGWTYSHLRAHTYPLAHTIYA